MAEVRAEHFEYCQANRPHWILEGRRAAAKRERESNIRWANSWDEEIAAFEDIFLGYPQLSV